MAGPVALFLTTGKTNLLIANHNKFVSPSAILLSLPPKIVLTSLISPMIMAFVEHCREHPHSFALSRVTAFLLYFAPQVFYPGGFPHYGVRAVTYPFSHPSIRFNPSVISCIDVAKLRRTFLSQPNGSPGTTATLACSKSALAKSILPFNSTLPFVLP